MIRRAPLDTINVTPKGGYGYDRGDVEHYAWDLGAPHKTPVYAPEDLEVLYFATDDKTKPLTGYGPGAILARGASGAYHVLGHLDAWGWSIVNPYGYPDGRALRPYVGRTYRAGELVGYVSRLDHVHWEIRDTPLPSKADRGVHTMDPQAWLDGADPASSTAPRAARGGSGAGIILLLALVILIGDGS